MISDQIVIASEAKQSSRKSGLLRRFAPRNDDPAKHLALIPPKGIFFRCAA
jgi:hypothetical protein